MRNLLLYAIVFGALPLIFLQPYIGALMWAWIAYMAPHRFTWGGAYHFPFAQVVAIVMIAAWLLSREPKRLPLSGITGVLMLFVAWLSLTTFFALVQDAAWRIWEEAMKVIVMSLITYNLIQSKNRIIGLVIVIVVSIGFFGVKGGIFVIATGGQYLVLGPPNSGLTANNAMGLALTMLIPLIWFLQMEVKWQPVRWLFWVAIALCALSVFGSYSRGAFLAIIVMAAYMVFRTRRYLILIPPFLIIGVILGMAFMPEKWVARIQTIHEYEQDASAMGRLRMWGYGWSVATERPVFGGGFGIYPATQHYESFGFALCEPGVSDEVTANCTMMGRTAHNIFMEVLGEHGFIGLTLFVLLAMLGYRTAGWVSRATIGRPDLTWAGNLSRMLQVSMVGYLVGGMFMDRAYFNFYYHLLVITAATASVVRAELSKEPAAAPAAVRGPPAPNLEASPMK